MPRGKALINKGTLALLRETTKVSSAYLGKKVRKEGSVVLSWEDQTSDVLPTINQAKLLAKTYSVPFASLYMNPQDINLEKLPNLVNRRTIQDPATQDDSALNIALIDMLNVRQLFIEVNEELEESIQAFNISITGTEVKAWAEQIRAQFDIDLTSQYQCPSTRQFYLYLKRQIEHQGVFIQCFDNVPIETARGISIYYDLLPVIGINADDRPPAKSFSIIHELVHIIKRTSSICNDMYTSLVGTDEEVFCNAVAGEVLVPESALKIKLEPRRGTAMTVEIIQKIADQFCVSKEVIARRLLDIKPAYYEPIKILMERN